MAKVADRRLRRMEHDTRFVCAHDLLSEEELAYVDAYWAANDAMLLVFLNDFEDELTPEERRQRSELIARFGHNPDCTPPSDAHFSAASKRRIGAVIDPVLKHVAVEYQKAEAAGLFPTHPATTSCTPISRKRV